MDVNETMLPGVGIRYEFDTQNGGRFGVITYRDGRVDLLTYDPDDPDRCTTVAILHRHEVETLAELLGAPRIVERSADLTREIPGLISEKIAVPDDSTFLGQPLGDTQCRTRTGSSVVAIVRGDTVVTSPAPSELLQSGDVLVAIGTSSGLAAVKEILSGA